MTVSGWTVKLNSYDLKTKEQINGIRGFKIKSKENPIISVILSKEFHCGRKIYCDDSTTNEIDFIEKTLICISNGNWARTFETTVYRLRSFNEELVTVPDIFLLNTSKFEVYKRG